MVKMTFTLDETTVAQLRQWIDAGRLGEIYTVHHTNRFNEDIATWYTDHPDYLFLDHGLHYFDLVRHLSETDTAKRPHWVEPPVDARLWEDPLAALARYRDHCTDAAPTAL